MVEINTPELWRDSFPVPGPDDHKYSRGHAVIVGSDRYTGATRLAAEACSRIGSGLVTVLNTARLDLYRTCLPPDIMIEAETLSNCRNVNTVLAGPGGISEAQADTLNRTDANVRFVLDADAIRLLGQVALRDSIVTPHAGEFERYFCPIGDNRTEAAGNAARSNQCVLVLKGAQTLICDPSGRTVENQTATPYLAKAGTGDVLAGFIAGLVAQGMPQFEAACAAVWVHGRAAERIGPGLVPQDLFGEIGRVLREILS
ncbi:MAG: NAD(P)H-hydrate dehydratase [Henriciella sp.]